MASKLGIIAGLGDLPVNVAQQALGLGRDIYVLRLDGFVEPKLDEFDGDIVGIGEIGKHIKLLKAAGCEEVVFAGIVKRPDFSKLKLDMRGTLLLPKVIAAARKGDDALLRTLVGTLEKEGFKVRGAEDFNNGLLAPAGIIAGGVPSEHLMEDLKRAAHVASVIGVEDIGQGCVVRDGLVVAVEAQEGTDAMLKRVASLPRTSVGGVLVKRPKPMQERRIDLPTIGVNTIKAVSSAGLKGIGLEAGGALILDIEQCKHTADQLDVFLYGFPRDWGEV